MWRRADYGELVLTEAKKDFLLYYYKILKDRDAGLRDTLGAYHLDLEIFKNGLIYEIISDPEVTHLPEDLADEKSMYLENANMAFVSEDELSQDREHTDTATITLHTNFLGLNRTYTIYKFPLFLLTKIIDLHYPLAIFPNNVVMLYYLNKYITDNNRCENYNTVRGDIGLIREREYEFHEMPYKIKIRNIYGIEDPVEEAPLPQPGMGLLQQVRWQPNPDDIYPIFKITDIPFSKKSNKKEKEVKKSDLSKDYIPVTVKTNNYIGYGIALKNKDASSRYNVLTGIRGKYKFLNITGGQLVGDNAAIAEYCSVTINSSEKSGEIFGNKRFKSTMVGKTYDIQSFTEQFNCKKDGIRRDIVEIISDTGATTKFLLEECDIVFPGILKGYKAPKDRTFSPGKKAIIAVDKGLSLKKGKKVTIIDVLLNKTINKRGDNLIRVEDNNKKIYLIKKRQLKLCEQ